MGFYGGLMGFYGGLMGCYGGLMGFYGDLMVIFMVISRWFTGYYMVIILLIYG